MSSHLHSARLCRGSKLYTYVAMSYESNQEVCSKPQWCWSYWGSKDSTSMVDYPNTLAHCRSPVPSYISTSDIHDIYSFRHSTYCLTPTDLPASNLFSVKAAMTAAPTPEPSSAGTITIGSSSLSAQPKMSLKPLAALSLKPGYFW